MKHFTTDTPWGYAQSVEQLATGLVSVSTASHGGLWLNEERWAKLRATFPSFSGYAPDQWLEEDLDWCLAPLLWPDEFTEQSVYFAVRTARTYRSGFKPDDGFYFPDARAWLDTEAGARASGIAASYSQLVLNKWERGSASTCDGGWRVWFSRISATGGHELSTARILADFPSQTFYTDEELDRITLPELEVA